MVKIVMKIAMKKCARCKRRFRPKAAGRPARFCSPACRQSAYLDRKVNRLHPVALLAADLENVRVREWLRREMWAFMRELGLVQETQPPPMPKQSSKRPKPNLTLVPPPDE